jgi:separase
MSGCVRPASQLAGSLRDDLNAPSNITAETATLLHAVLFAQDTASGTASRPPAPSKVAAKRPPLRSKPPSTGRNKDVPSFNIHEAPLSRALQPDLKTRRRLAVEGFNACLKALNVAVKVQTQAQCTEKSTSLSEARPNHRPLKECSPNRKEKPTRERQKGPSHTNHQHIARCCSHALDWLRANTDRINDEAVIDDGLESGGLVLLDKAITLELLDVAESQCSKLYEQYWKRRKSSTDSQQAGLLFKRIGVAEEGSIADFKFATSLQAQTLRLSIARGPTRLSQLDLSRLALDSEGSPAWMVKRGFEQGYLDSASCGKQLRTISLALVKLHDLLQSADTNVICTDTLHLYCLALQMKCLSWKYLNQKPELSKGLWCPLWKVVTDLSTRPGHGETNIKQAVEDCVQMLRVTLDGADFEAAVPSYLQDYLKTSVNGTKTTKNVRELESQYEETPATAKSQRLLLGIRICLGRFPPAACDYEKAKTAADMCCDSLDFIPETQADYSTVLIPLAHLRKALMTILHQIDESISRTTSTSEEQGFIGSIIQLTVALLNFFARSYRSLRPETAMVCSASSTILAYAKSMEMVLVVERCDVDSFPGLDTKVHVAVLDCVDFAEALLSDLQPDMSVAVGNFFRSVKSRASHILWRRYIKLTEQGRSVDARLEVLNSSIEMARQCLPEQQQAAMLGLKYEKSAALHVLKHQYSMAQLALTSAIDLAIEQGLLEEATTLYLTRADGHTCLDSKSGAHGLGSPLSSHVVLSLEQKTSDHMGRWYYDDLRLANLNRTVLIENQIIAALRECPKKLSDIQLSASLNLWDELSLEAASSTHRLRFLSLLLYRLEKDHTRKASPLIESLRFSVIRSTTRDDTYTPTSCRPLISTLVDCQWAFASCAVSEQDIRSYPAAFLDIVSSIQSHDQFCAAIPDLQIFTATLKLLSDYAGLMGCLQAQKAAIHCLLALMEYRPDQGTERKVALMLNLATVQTSLGDFAEAKKNLSLSEPIVAVRGAQAQTRWHLTSSELCIAQGDWSQGCHQLSLCMNLQPLSEQSSSTRERVDQSYIVARAAYISAQIAYGQRNLQAAVHYAWQAVKLTGAFWPSVEKALTESTTPRSNENESTLQSVIQEMSNLDITEASQAPQSALNYSGMRYWELVTLHRYALRLLSSLSAHQGIYQDTLCFSQTAMKVTEWTAGMELREVARSELVLSYAAAGQKDLAMSLLPSPKPQLELSMRQCEAIVNYADASLLLKQPDIAKQYLQQASLRFKSTTSAQKPVPETKSAPRSTAAPRGRVASRKQPVIAPKRSSVRKIHKKEPTQTTAAESMHVKTIQARLASLRHRFFVEGHLTFEELPPLSGPQPGDELGVTLFSAVTALHQGLAQLASNPASNAIAETAIAIPVRRRQNRKSGQMSLLMPSPNKNQLNTLVASQVALENGDDLLHAAFVWLSSIEKHAAGLSAAHVDLLFESMARSVLLSTAVGRPLSHSPLGVVLQALRPKDTVFSRECYTIAAERGTASREDCYAWPQVDHREALDDTCDLNIPDLPSTWTIVTIGLSYDKKELLLSRMTARSTPFLMRVPLERPSVIDDEPYEFTLNIARQELSTIIEQADQTCHDARGGGTKQERKAWFAQREELDKSLEALLKNMENIWFGGFRGLLTGDCPDEQSLARFGADFATCLNKHLPSRQKRSKTKTRIDLHAHVLELFTSLPFDQDSSDLEDSITDLLYFVVDVLLFSGEPNAFDEIDFDAMLMEVLDALRGHHSRITAPTKAHMILIIDKELQCFPWESMPCLRGRAVSRMPSLGAIRARLELMRAQSTQSQAYSVSRTGKWLLNPSGDLKNTQAVFEPMLQQLSGFAGSSQAPNENELESMLTDNSVFLYFGHGSGLQYIRGRSIRKLEQCAVTWLMGCSSAKLTECGTFESYGTPWHYMHAGSPAVVGTLWDVTDRDIDRFAVKGLGDWGVLDTSVVDEAFWAKGAVAKGKNKAKITPPNPTKPVKAMTLDEAVAKARDACQLKFLNGAAPVVYGIPVVLD